MKLYWRVKINGKWTWRPARVTGGFEDVAGNRIHTCMEPEEIEDGS